MHRSIFISVLLLIYMSLFQGEAMSAWKSHDCGQVVATPQSIQGVVEIKSQGKDSWEKVTLETTCCPGDTLRTKRYSRAAFLLENNTVLRLDQNSTIVLYPQTETRHFLIRLIKGVLNYFSIKPRSLEIETPFVNGAVEGTEFSLAVTEDSATVSVFEGQVNLTNSKGTVLIGPGASGQAERNKNPVKIPYIKQANAVQWALYYPPLLSEQWYDSEDTIVKQIIDEFYPSDIGKGIEALEKNQLHSGNTNYIKTLTCFYLMVGRVSEAENELRRAEKIDKNDSDILAIQAVISLVKGFHQQAKEQSLKALSINPSSTTTLIAHSYVQQTSFDLSGARSSIEEALSLRPDDGLLLARQAELIQAMDITDENALLSAERAIEKSPHLSHPYTISGFIHLNRQDIQLARTAFEKSVELDQAAPLPRLGLALVEIYLGNLEQGRDLLSLAVTLDPNSSIIRSYLGKAYFDEKEYSLSSKQFKIAKTLDPNDPTPFYYSAIQNIKQNNPGKALNNFQQSIALNDNRAVFRSKFMLDQDLASRSAGTGRLFNQLGFEQLALNYGTKALEASPSDYSSHRLLADSYLLKSRYEIARVSELLQSQLLQPENIVPLQPQATETNLQIITGTGPATPSFYEFNSLFQQNRTDLLINAVAGGNSSIGNDLVASTVYDKFSLNFGQYYYSTDGFRDNNDLEQELYNLFAQYHFSPKTQVMGEFRLSNIDKGDIILFDQTLFNPDRREEEEKQSWRLGGHHVFNLGSEIIATVVNQELEEQLSIDDNYGTFDSEEDTNGWSGEVQHLFSKNNLNTRIGGSYFDGELTETAMFNSFLIDVPDTTNFDHTSLYAYGYYPLLPAVDITGAINYTDLDHGRNKIQEESFSPKIGISWQPTTKTTLRAAWITGVSRLLLADQTIEPTIVAGFNQFFDDVIGTESKTWAVAFDQEFSSNLFGGVSYSSRDLDVPYRSLHTESARIEYTEWQEETSRAYLYYLPTTSVSLALEYLYEDRGRAPDYYDEYFFEQLQTHETTFSINWFHPSGLTSGLNSSYVYQEGTFVDPTSFIYLTTDDSDSFWVTDLSLSYLLPKGYGMLSFDIKNLFDSQFSFQEATPESPRFSRDRLLALRFTCKF